MARSTSNTLVKGEFFQSINPSDGRVIWEGPSDTHESVAEAVKSARAAFPGWADRPMEDRIQLLKKYGELLDSKREILARAISDEMGKAFWEANLEVSGMIGKIAISEKAQSERCGISHQELAHGQSYTRHKPHGVLAIFGPFNFPGHLPNGHIVPALLAGNTVVFKPSEITPMVGGLLVDCLVEAGIPEGVVNLVQGSTEVGKALAQHPDIDGLCFTGSSRTGLLLSEYFGKQPQKILALEMGGNNPIIVEELKEIEAACYQIVQSAYATTGQRCTCARRLLLPEGGFGDDLLSALVEWIGRLRIDAPHADPQPYMGPVVSAQSAEHLLKAQDTLMQLGGRAILEMKSLKPDTGFVSPGLIDVSAVSQLPDQEYFGPLLQVIRYRSFDEAIKIANNTAYGLSAALLSDSEASYKRFYREIRAGIVNWNTQTTGAASSAPFGGTGISGNHRPSAYYAADYCNYPVASLENSKVEVPAQLPPGIDRA